MYIPSADIGEYDDYHQPQPVKPAHGGGRQYGSLERQQSRAKMGSLDRQPSRGKIGNLERTPSRAKLGKQPRLPSGYFVLDGKVQPAKPEQRQGQLKRQQSFNR